MSLQHCDSSFAHCSRYSGAIAAFLVVAFVMLAAFVHSATACGLSDPAGGSCFQPGGAATLAALLVASFVFVLLLFVVQEPAGVDGLNLFYVIDGLSTLVSVYWFVDGVFNIYRSCGSCICFDASCSCLCASVGSLTFLEGDICFLVGVLAHAVVAHCSVGVFNITCGCGSCIGLGLLSSICSAFVGVCFVFEGAFEIASSLSSNIISGGLWFSGLAGQPQKAKDNDYYDYSRSLSLQASGFVTADIDESLIKASGEHGIVSSLPEGLGQASRRVDVPDDAKVEAAAAVGGTLRSGPGSLDALGSPRSREGKIQFFLKGHDGCTRVINCRDWDLIHDVVGYVGWDIYATLHGHILDLSGTLQSQGVSDNDTIRVSCRLRGGSNNTDIPGQWQCANCDATRCWPVRRNCYRCGAPRPETPPAPGPLGRDPPPGPSSVPPTTREPRVVPPGGPPGAGVGTSPRDPDSAVLPGELLGALKLLQTVMSAEDFSKYEKLVAPPSKEERTKEREQLLWEKVQSQNRLRKQEAGHVEQIAKLEADAAKQRAMLQSVREQLEAVDDEVCALRALVADPSVPTGPTPEPPPLPAPRTPPPPSQDLLDIATPLDEDMEDCENEEELEWPPVRRFSRLERRNKIGVIKGFTKHRRERSFRKMICSLRTWAKISLVRKLLTCCATCPMRSSWKFYKIVLRACCSSSRQTFLLRSLRQWLKIRQVPVGSASRLRDGNQAKRHSFLKFPFLAVMLVPGQQRLTVFCVLLFWVLRPQPAFQVLWQVKVLSCVLDTLRLWITRWMVLLWSAPAVTPNAVSGWGQFRLMWAMIAASRTLATMSSLLLVLVAGGWFRLLDR